jgi:hypothetical protein
VLATTAALFAAVRSQEYRWTGERIYLNAASYGPLPERARAATEEFDRRRQRAELADPDFLSLRCARAAWPPASSVDWKRNHARPQHAGRHQPRGTHCRDARARRAIVISDREFPANIYPG